MPQEIALTEKQIKLLEASYKHPVTFYGGARGGGKSYGLRALIIIRAMETPGIRIGLFRRTYPELRANHIDKFLQEYPQLNKFYNSSQHVISLPNGSKIEFCHCQNRDSVELYQGREYEILAIDEAGQFEEDMMQRLRGSNRTSMKGINPVTILTGNPGGIGHGWLKRLFIERNFRDLERPTDYNFIQSRVYDCPPLMDNDPDYVHRLEAEPNEAIRKAYLDGDWDVFAGQFFGEFSREEHVVQPFKIAEHWRLFGAYDPGYFHPSAFGWFACDELGQVFLYRELVERGLRIDELAAKINSYEDTQRFEYITAGADCWAHGRDGGPTIAEQFNNHDLILTKANTDRVQGAAQVRSYLAPDPRIKLFSTCIRTINCLPNLIHDDKRPEDVHKIDATENDPFSGDDCYDMLRYGLMSRPLVTEKPKESKYKHLDKESKKFWIDFDKEMDSLTVNKKDEFSIYGN